MSKDVIKIGAEDVELLDVLEYNADVEAHFSDVPTVAEHLISEAKARQKKALLCTGIYQRCKISDSKDVLTRDSDR